MCHGFRPQLWSPGRVSCGLGTKAIWKLGTSADKVAKQLPEVLAFLELWYFRGRLELYAMKGLCVDVQRESSRIQVAPPPPGRS